MNDYLIAKLREKGWIAADADVASINLQEVIGQKMAAKELTLDQYTKWCDDYKAVALAKQNETANTRKEFATDVATAVATALVPLFAKATAQPAANELEAAATAAAGRIGQQGVVTESAINPADVFKAAQSGTARLRKATEMYMQTKGLVCYDSDGRAPWQKAGHPVQYFSGHMNQEVKRIDSLSEAEKAKAMGLIAIMMKNSGIDIPIPEHVRALAEESLHEDKFVGGPDIGGMGGRRKLSELEVKTILDDSTSGGQYAVPEWFDTALVLTPLLYGELFPYVNVIPVPRGDSADGATLGVPTFVSTAEGSAVTPFTTTSFIGNFDTTFFPATCAIEMGLDWEADALPGMAQQIITQIGLEAMRWLDEQIAIGDGTTEPQGIFTATGISASAANGTSGALTYNDALNMVFGMSKAARNYYGGATGNRVRYVLNDTQYAKFMKIATGVTGDTRPIFGMNVKAYQLGDYPVSVQQNITSGDMAFANLAAYRLYRRQGIQFLQDETGRTNRLSHTRLVMARMRWGGQIERPTTYVVQMLNGDTSA